MFLLCAGLCQIVACGHPVLCLVEVNVSITHRAEDLCLAFVIFPVCYWRFCCFRLSRWGVFGFALDFAVFLIKTLVCLQLPPTSWTLPDRIVFSVLHYCVLWMLGSVQQMLIVCTVIMVCVCHLKIWRYQMRNENTSSILWTGKRFDGK